jgi:nickel-dependent lactate racemase
METRLVKPLHPLDEIAHRIAQADGSGVQLSREKSGNGRMGETEAHIVDPVAATIRALAEPLEYPPLSAGIVPGDRVAIAVDEDVPQVASVVRGAVEALKAAGVEAQDISIVTTNGEVGDLCQSAIAESEQRPQFVVHDPADENNLCLVGTMKRGEPLLVNKAMFDADLVLPIGCARLGRIGSYESVFPRFSNAETLQRYRMQAKHDAIVKRSGKRNEIDEAGWMIGVPMTVQVVPGRDEAVAHVIAGEPQAVSQRCDELCQEEWLLRSPRRVSLVVATIAGDAIAQSWANVGRALAATESVLEEGGAVAICSNLEQSPGHSLGRLIRSDDPDAAARRIFHDQDADSWTAWQLSRALERGPVYFLSQLDSDTVEDMGLAHVESVDDLVRLAGRHESFVVVENSQHAAVVVDGEERDD